MTKKRPRASLEEERRLAAIFHPEPDWDRFLAAIKRKPATSETVLEAIYVWEGFPAFAGRILTDDVRKAIKAGIITQHHAFAPKIIALQKLMQAHQETTLFLAAQVEKARLDSSTLSGCAEAGLLAICQDPVLSWGFSSIPTSNRTSEENVGRIRDAQTVLLRLKAKVKMDAPAPPLPVLPPAGPKVELDAERLRVRIGKKWHDVTVAQKDMLAVLFKAKGEWVGGKTFGADARPDKTRNSMKRPVAKMIQTNKAQGYRIPALLP